MVGAVQDRHGGITGICRTWLRPDGSGKAEIEPQKAALGSIATGAVRLAEAAPRLVLAEGIETGLSVQQVKCLPVWVVLGASNLEHVALPKIVQEVIIAADNDANGVGQAAAYEAAHRFIAQGRRAWVAIPREQGSDWNDVLRGVGR
jgi:putative DNA primase/helicase